MLLGKKRCLVVQQKSNGIMYKYYVAIFLLVLFLWIQLLYFSGAKKVFFNFPFREELLFLSQMSSISFKKGEIFFSKIEFSKTRRVHIEGKLKSADLFEKLKKRLSFLGKEIVLKKICASNEKKFEIWLYYPHPNFLGF